MPKLATTFGLMRVDLVIPGPTPSYKQIRGAEEVEFSSDMETVEVVGDDGIIAYWNHGLKGELKIKSNVIDFEIIEAITGNPVVTEAGPPARDYVYGGTDHDLSAPEFMVRVDQRGKHPQTGEPCIHRIHFFRCLGRVSITGAKYGEATGMEISAKLLQSTTDEKGATINPTMWRQEFLPVEQQ